MIELGLVKFIQAGLGDPPMAPGGFAVQLPPNLIGEKAGQVSKAWVYRTVADDPSIVIEGEDGVTCWHVAIDCHGVTMADAIALWRAINAVLRGAESVTFEDPDSIFVQSIQRGSLNVDGYSDLNRSFVKTVEYAVHYNQP